MKRKEQAIVTGQERLAPEIFSMWLETELAKEAQPGQFIGVYPRDMARMLMRPISICEVSDDRTRLRLVYRALGDGTREFSHYAIGDTVTVLGVLGNGYDTEALKKKRVLLLGGGIGIPPMLYLAKRLQELAKTDSAADTDAVRASGGADTETDAASLRRSPVVAVLGYADQNTFSKKEFDAVCPTYVASMDGSVGTKGTVIDALNSGMLMGDVVCACGPLPMLKAVRDYAADFGMRAYLSLEERMACGVGACLGCVVKTKETNAHTHVNNARVCMEGPVFDAAEVVL